MTKDVLVTVRGLQMTPDGDDTIEVTTTGKYYEKDGKRYLFYDEIGDDTNLIVKNSIQITEEHVSVSKKGLINAQMNFEKENKLVSVYETPYGQMEMGVYTTGICLDERDDFLELKLEYLLEINNQHVSDSEILLQIRPLSMRYTAFCLLLYLFFFPLDSVFSAVVFFALLSFLKRAKKPFFLGGAGIAPPRTLLISVM
ncbi:MAG: hypothetical protein BHV88_08545 [Clostridiales bacterium 41_12_two_minus]|nr:MAG: hypothetical protein BHV88_08545 [Clostridiales bacterium 41_12_two_minus]